MTEPLTAPATTPRKHGCFFYGCLTLIILALLGGTVTFFGVRYALKRVTAYIEQYTDTTPTVFPKVEMSPSALDALQKRVATFQEALQDGKPAEALVLTSDELNELLASSRDLARVRDCFRLNLESDQVKAQVSLPLDQLISGFSRLKGRYLNGSATLKTSLENGVLVVTLQSLEVKGQKVPEEVMRSLRQQNLAKDVYQDPKNAQTLSRLESVKIEDGRVVVKARAKE